MKFKIVLISFFLKPALYTINNIYYPSYHNFSIRINWTQDFKNSRFNGCVKNGSWSILVSKTLFKKKIRRIFFPPMLSPRFIDNFLLSLDYCLPPLFFLTWIRKRSKMQLKLGAPSSNGCFLSHEWEIIRGVMIDEERH